MPPHDKGPVVRQACDNGCIGCKICVKACPKEGAIVVENFLAKINYDICIGCGMCSRACPRSADHCGRCCSVPETQEARGTQARSGPRWRGQGGSAQGRGGPQSGSP